MSSRQRVVLLAIAAVILVAGILIAAGSGGDEEPGTTETTAASPPETTAGENGTTQPAPAPKPRVETIRIRGGRPAGGEQKLGYKSGDTIRLRFVADAPGEVHIHGFDKELEVGTTPKTVRLEADLEGIFEIEEHDSGAVLATLEIRPK